MTIETLTKKTSNCGGLLTVLEFQPLLSWQGAWPHVGRYDGVVSVIDIFSLSLLISPLC